MTATRWYLQRDPLGVRLTVEELAPERRGVTTYLMVPGGLTGDARHDVRRNLLPQLRDELNRRLAQVGRSVTIYDPADDGS